MSKDPKRWWDIWNVLALLAAIIVVSSRLVATTWTQNLNVIQYLTILAFILGLVFGISRFSSLIATLMVFVYGAIGIPWLLGIVLSPDMDWHTRLITMAERLGAAATLFIAKKPVYDPILFLLLMSVLFFTLSLSASYNLVRNGSPWLAILPGGLALLIINHYDHFSNSGLQYIGVYVLLALLILGRLTLLHQRAEWKQEGVFFSPETSGDLNRVTLLVVAGLLIFSWSIPVISSGGGGFSDFWTNTIAHPWSTLSTRISNAFSSLQTRTIVVQNFFGNNLALTSGSYLGDNVLFTVNSAAPTPSGVRFYWQARTYTAYADGQWAANYVAKSFNTITYNINYPNYADHQLIEFTFTSKTNLQNAPTAQMPVWTSLPVQALLATAPDGTEDSMGLIANPIMTSGQVYRERSSISVPNVTDLQAAATNYPTYISSVYLQIPTSLEPKFKQLALQITAGMKTPYDKAIAITNWLRSNITYKEVIPTPPPGQDPIEWFLFQLKQGYCNYYASAEVLLLRSIGIPARLSVGYAAGTYDPLTNAYTVLANDAHAWPEVYFTGLGWIIFEPTVSQPALTFVTGGSGTNTGTQPATPTPSRIGGGSTQPSDQPGQNQPGSTSSGGTQALIQNIFVGLGILAGLGFLVALFRVARPRLEEIALPVRVEKTLTKYHLGVPRWLHRWSLRMSLTPFEKAFMSLVQALRLLGKPVLPAQTPAERVMILSEALPEARQPAETLLIEYQRAEYSPYPANLPRAVIAGLAVRQLAFRAFLRRLFRLPGR